MLIAKGFGSPLEYHVSQFKHFDSLPPEQTSTPTSLLDYPLDTDQSVTKHGLLTNLTCLIS